MICIDGLRDVKVCGELTHEKVAEFEAQRKELEAASEAAKNISNTLNHLLANYQIFYMNTRGFHWNITGASFFELHAKFEELYNDSLIKIDEIAERILTLGETPLHTYADFLEIATINASKHITDGKAAIKDILNAYSILLPLERTILDNAAEANDEGTAALMSDYIREQEKLVWMFTAYLKNS